MSTEDSRVHLTCWGWRSQMMELIEPSNSSMNGITSPTCDTIGIVFIFFNQHKKYLNLNKLPPALEGNLDEGVTGHVLYSLVGLVHELKQLVDHGLEEPPVRPQEPGVLSHDVHDVGSDDGLVVLAFFLLAESE